MFSAVANTTTYSKVYHNKPQNTGHTAKLVYYLFTIVNLTFTIVKYGQRGLYQCL